MIINQMLLISANNNFQPQSCMQHRQPLFSFSVRIQKKMSRLNIYEEDNLEDVLERFGKLAKAKGNFQQKIKERLENQLRRFVSERECSERVKGKIQAFLEESKVVIVGISQTEHFEKPTMQKIEKFEQDSCRRDKKMEKEQIKLFLPVSHDVSPVLTKYLSKEILLEQPQEEKSSEEKVYKTTNRHKDNTNYEKTFLPSQHSHQNYNTSDFDIRKGNHPLADIDKIIQNRIARSQQRQLRADIARSGHQRKLSATPAQNKYDQPKLTSYESYQSYKLSQRDHNLTKQSSRQCFNTSNTPSKEYLQPSQYINTIKQQQTTSISTKFDYNRCLQSKGVTGGYKENKKFKYIS